jgi:hypothetical protein
MTCGCVWFTFPKVPNKALSPTFSNFWIVNKNSLSLSLSLLSLSVFMVYFSESKRNYPSTFLIKPSLSLSRARALSLLSLPVFMVYFANREISQ